MLLQKLSRILTVLFPSQQAFKASAHQDLFSGSLERYIASLEDLMLFESSKHLEAKFNVVAALKLGHMVQYLPVSLFSFCMILQSVHNFSPQSSSVILIDLRQGISFQFLVLNIMEQVLYSLSLESHSIVLQSSFNESPVILLLLGMSKQAFENLELPFNNHTLSEIFGLEQS